MIKISSFLFISAISLLSIVSKAQNPIVKLPQGLIEGSFNEDTTIQIFKGIPFAKPPIGDLRWKAPEAMDPWNGVLNCQSFGPSPFQNKPFPFMFWSEEFLIPEEPISEDCLYLNVWSKRDKSELKPVVVYIYGGGFVSGGSACPIYDGESMASKDIVFVSLNYRVGVFGFLAHPELSRETEHNTSGNYALMDMIAGLKWIKDNIHLFGGDANNVTIAGQSAGAFAVNYLTISPLSKGLFHKAIAQSGGDFYESPFRPALNLAEAEEMGLKWLEKIRVENIAGLRAKSPEEILKASGPSFPIIDGYVLKEKVYDSYMAGDQMNIPIMLGWNEDDIVFVQNFSKSGFKEHLQKKFSSMDTSQLFKLYPARNDEELKRSVIDLSRDESFAIQGFSWAKIHEITSNSKVFLYNFSRHLPFYDKNSDFGAFHSSEIVYFLDNLDTLDRPWEKEDYDLAGVMSSYWTNFVKSGDPNDEKLAVWPEFNNKNYIMKFDKNIGKRILPNLNQMEFWTNYLSNTEKSK